MRSIASTIDNYHRKERRGRAAPLNMVVTETGAAKAVEDMVASFDDGKEPKEPSEPFRILDYADEAAIEAAARGCGAAGHLVGIIKEGGGGRYEIAHEATCEVLADAAQQAGARRIVDEAPRARLHPVEGCGHVPQVGKRA